MGSDLFQLIYVAVLFATYQPGGCCVVRLLGMLLDWVISGL